MSKSETNEKINPITIKDENGNTKYTLEFNRDSVKWAERRGFKMDELTDFPQTNIPLLFFYSFRMHHKGVTQQITDEILEDIGATPALLERLISLYNATLDSLIGEEVGKNAKFSAEF